MPLSYTSQRFVFWSFSLFIGAVVTYASGLVSAPKLRGSPSTPTTSSEFVAQPERKSEDEIDDLTKPCLSSTLEHALSMHAAYEKMGSIEDLEHAIVIYRQLLPQRNVRALCSLSSALQRRFHFYGEDADIDDAIELARKAREIAVAGSEDHRNSLMTLGNALRDRSMEKGSDADLDESLSLCKMAVDGCPLNDACLPEWLNNLGRCYRLTFTRRNSLDGIEEAIRVHRRAIGLGSVGDLEYPRSMACCATALRLRFEKQSGIEHLEEAIALYRGALEHSHPGDPDRRSFLAGLGAALTLLYRARGSPSDLEDAIRAKEQALEISPRRHVSRPDALSALANSLRDRFEELGDKEDLNRSISLVSEALSIRPPGHPHRSTAVNILATSYSMRFEDQGEMVDLEQAIKLFHEGLELRPAPHPQRFASLSNLAVPLYLRYSELGHTEDLETAIDLYRQVLPLTPVGHPFRSQALSHLAAALCSRFEESARAVDLEEAVTLLREAMSLGTPGDLSWYFVVMNLSSALQIRHRHFRSAIDIDEAVDLVAQTLSRSSVPNHFLPRLHVTLGSAYRQRFAARKVTSDALEALHHLTEAQGAYDARNPERVSCLSELARLYLEGDTPFFNPGLALQHTLQAILEGNCSAQARIAVASDVLRSMKAELPDEFRDLLLQTQLAIVNLLPHAAYFGLGVKSRLSSLKKGEMVATQAATNALTLSRLPLAIEVLEQGRGIFWTQALRLRTPFDALDQRLGRPLIQLARELEGRSHSSNVRISQFKADEEMAYRRQLTLRFNSLVDEIRERPGMDGFLRPDKFETLAKAAEKGPVVILIPGGDFCSAIVVRTSYEPMQVLLAGVTDTWLHEASTAWRDAMVNARNSLATEHRLGIAKVSLRKHVVQGQDAILGKLWEFVVYPIFQALRLKPSSGRERPRLWWCPTGSFAFLPLHAAGKTDSQGAVSCSDYIVSSYTPTLSALLNARRTSTRPIRNEMRVLVGAAPITEWNEALTALPHTRDEVREVTKIIPHHSVLALPAEEDVCSDDVPEMQLGMRAATLTDLLPKTTVLHLACHAVQNADSPLDSGFALRDGQLSIAEIMKMHLPNAFLAYLSACETAKGDNQQPDQTVHLAAAMLFAGFKSVVATLWSMNDVDGPHVAGTVYRQFFDGDSEYLDPDIIPYALDTAAQQLRRAGHPPSRWAPFIHIGI